MKKKRLIRIGLILLFLLLLAGVGFGIYAGDYYHADEEALASFSNLPENILQSEEKVSGEDVIVFSPKEATTGLIFYPGGKVEAEAYAPLARKIAEKGILCVIVKMPFHLAVFDIEAADGISDAFPQVEDWYIGGHSLGGAMASVYAEKHSEELEGLVLLAAYSSVDLSQTELAIISIYGSEDGVMNRDKYQKYYNNLGEEVTEVVIEGGCHSYFGNYGMQNGDGEPTISREEQMEQTAQILSKKLERAR